MSRWAPDARARLERAAIELFLEHGYGATTVPQIAERAGLTTRSFFRHFADKREVIFAGDEIPELAARMLAEAPPDIPPLPLLVDGLERVAADRFEGRRDVVRRVRGLIRAEPSLWERDLLKRAALSDALRVGLVGRGVPPTEAALLADSTVSVLHIALEDWLDRDDGTPLGALTREAFGALRGALGPTADIAGRR